MAARGLIPDVEGLSPLDAADLAHAEAQFVAKRLALRALADGRNLLFDISMASRVSVDSWLGTLRQAGYSVGGIFVDIGIEESVCRSTAAYRRGHEEYRAGRGYGGRYIPPEAIRALAGAPACPPIATPDTGAGGGEAPGELPGSEVTSLLAAYACGQRPVEDPVWEFRARRWPTGATGVPAGDGWCQGRDLRSRALRGGSFDDVVRAYDLGQITDADYEAFVTAAT